jgi:NADH-quinone oxidoreductase subunit M
MNLYFIIVLSKLGKSGFIFSIVQHSFVISLLFFLCDTIEKFCNTRSILALKHSNTQLCKLKYGMLLGTLASIGIPATSGFIAEMLSILSVAKISGLYAISIALGILAMASVAFKTYVSTFGVWKNSEKQSIFNVYESIVIVSLVFMIVALGIYPNIINIC